MTQLDSLKSLILQVSQRIEETMAHFAEQVQRLKTIPGLGRRTAENLVAEIVVDTAQLPRSSYLTSWAGICPGNDQSGSKSRSGRTTKESQWLRQILTQSAWAAS